MHWKRCSNKNKLIAKALGRKSQGLFEKIVIKVLTKKKKVLCYNDLTKSQMGGYGEQEDKYVSFHRRQRLSKAHEIAVF